MRTLFIADLHLSEDHPEVTEAFFAFLANEVNDVDALYILGDLFEVWIGDDEHTQLMDEVAKRLTEYATSQQVKIFYIHGNRDFMIGKKFAQQSSMTLLDEHCKIKLYGQDVLIMHGDTLCLGDEHYQKMRKIVRNPLVQFIFNLLPLSMRKKIGWKIRHSSQVQKSTKKSQVMDVTESEVLRLMEQFQTQILIHGHTHQAAEHQFLVANKSAKRFDTGDWYDHFSYVEAQPKQIQLVKKAINHYAM